MNKQDFIVKYLHNELTDEQYDTFVNLVETDPAFAEDVKLESILYAQHKRTIKDELTKNATIKRIAQQTTSTQQQKSTIKTLFPFIRNIAAVFMLAIVAYYLMSDTNLVKSEPSSLVATHIKEYHQPPPGLRSGDNVSVNTWDIAIESYKQEKFELAIEQIEKISTRTNEQNLYLALSRLYSDKTDPSLKRAINDFNSILESNNPSRKDEAQWFLSLTQLLTKDSSKAINNLTEIVTSKAWNADKADKLLKKLK